MNFMWYCSSGVRIIFYINHNNISQCNIRPNHSKLFGSPQHVAILDAPSRGHGTAQRPPRHLDTSTPRRLPQGRRPGALITPPPLHLLAINAAVQKLRLGRVNLRTAVQLPPHRPGRHRRLLALRRKRSSAGVPRVGIGVLAGLHVPSFTKRAEVLNADLAHRGRAAHCRPSFLSPTYWPISSRSPSPSPAAGRCASGHFFGVAADVRAVYRQPAQFVHFPTRRCCLSEARHGITPTGGCGFPIGGGGLRSLAGCSMLTVVRASPVIATGPDRARPQAALEVEVCRPAQACAQRISRPAAR